MVAGKRIVLGVTGGVAAYKAAYIARRLIERGATVRAVMTPTASRFLGEATLAAITGAAPVTDLFTDRSISPHTELAAWADAIVVAPATAASLAKLATGQSSNALVATVLASTVPVVIAPAMHTEMWQHPATADNIGRLSTFGYQIIEPESGALAGGDEGVGRLADPDVIVERVEQLFAPGDLDGTRVLVTAGGTREPIDPVRYIGNRSSGKMGNALAESARDRGATVTLVTTVPSQEPRAGIEVVTVETAEQMADAVWSRAGQVDIAVLAAAVADFRPSDRQDHKLSRKEGLSHIDLEPTPDILAGVHASDPRPYLVGFAAQVGSLDGAVEKAAAKGVDLLVANDIAAEGSGFGSDTNRVMLVTRDGSTRDLPLMSKRRVADEIWNTVVDQRGGR